MAYTGPFPIIVKDGGTGAATLTGLLTGNGISPFTGTAITQYNVLTAGATNLPNSVAPSATSGVPLISQGAAAQPIFGTAVVAGGGTGVVSNTVYAVLCGGTTTTGPIQSIASVGTALQVLTSNGAGALPTFQTFSSTIVAWTDEAISFAAVANNGYFVTAAATATLPASPSQGNTVEIVADTATGVVITANTGQKIRLSTTLSAAAGSATNSAIGDSLTLVYRAADTTWYAISSIGNWTVA